MPTVTAINRRDIITLAIILFIAGWMRFGRGDIVEYFHDDAMLSTLALEMSDGEIFPLTGILSSTGIPNPPTSVYVMAIPFSLAADPNVAIHFVMLLNTVGVGLLWLLAHRYFGRLIAIFAGLMYAINPWAVLFSRKIWAQDFHTPFILLGFLLLLYGFWEVNSSERNNKRLRNSLARICSIPLLIFAFQIHFASWALFPVILVILWQTRRRMRWRSLFLSLILSCLILTPYILGLAQTLQLDPNRISDAANRSGISERSVLSTEPMVDTVYLVSGLGMETWVAPDQQEELSVQYPPLETFWLICIGFLLIGIYYCLRNYRAVFLFLIIWAFLPQILLIPAWTPIYVHYFIPTIPALMLISSMGLVAIHNKFSQCRLTPFIIGIVFVGLLISQVNWWHSLLDYVATQHIPYPGFTTPIKYLNDLRDDLKKSGDVIVISQGMAWNLHHEVAVWDTMLWDEVTCVRTIVGNGYAVLPQHPFTVVIAPDAPENPINNLYITDEATWYSTRNGDAGYTVYTFDSPPEWIDTEIQPIEPVMFDNNVQLVGYSLENDQIYLEWKLPAQHKGADYQYTAQLFDSEENRIAQLDKTFWHGRHWCMHDRFITWGNLSESTDATTLRIGMYQLGTGKNTGEFYASNILDEQGNPAGQSATINLETNR